MKDLLLNVVEISLSTSVVIAVLALLSPMLNKRYTAKWKYGIWIALALRLAVPIQFSLPQKQIVVDVPAGLAAPISAPVMVTRPTGAAVLPKAPAISALDVLSWVWLAGCVLYLVIHLGSYLHYKKTVMKYGTRVTDVSVLRQIRSISQELNLRGRLPVIQDPTAGSPMVLGFFRPILVMPDMEYQAMELYFVLKHELIHLKRHDMFAKLLFVAASAVHWFNPLVHLMQKEAVVDMELSCDERVVKGTVYEMRKAYTETLLSTLCRNYKKNTALSTQFYGGKAIMKKRFRNILTRARKKSGFALAVIAITATMILGMTTGCAVDASAADEPEIQETLPVQEIPAEETQAVAENPNSDRQILMEMTMEFTDAYFSGDADTINSYMSEFSDQLEENRFFAGELQEIVAYYGIPEEGMELEVGDYNPVFVEYKDSRWPDYVSNLMISFWKEESGWKVHNYVVVQGSVFDETANQPILDGDARELAETVEAFAMACFSGDRETVSSYIAEPHSDFMTKDTYEDFGFQYINAVKIPQDLGTVEIGEKVRASVEFIAREDDSYNYLEMYIVKEESGWKIFEYYIDK